MLIVGWSVETKREHLRQHLPPMGCSTRLDRRFGGVRCRRTPQWPAVQHRQPQVPEAISTRLVAVSLYEAERIVQDSQHWGCFESRPVRTLHERIGSRKTMKTNECKLNAQILCTQRLNHGIVSAIIRMRPNLGREHAKASETA